LHESSFSGFFWPEFDNRAGRRIEQSAAASPSSAHHGLDPERTMRWRAPPARDPEITLVQALLPG